MHMVDALISPLVGGAMLATTGSLITYSIRKIEKQGFKDKLPLMGVMGAFVFAAQMINFGIPGTGASGHLGGGMLLAILLGPYAGFLTMAAILLVQAIFFADGGLLAYGCNVFNLGFYTCFIAYPLIYKPLLKKKFSRNRLFGGALLSSIVGLQLGAFSVVIETILSGKTMLPLSHFLLAMQPIHLAIGILEGLIVAGMLYLIFSTHPSLIDRALPPLPQLRLKRLITASALFAFILGGLFSLFASSKPDGLEWAIAQITRSEMVAENSVLHIRAQALQEQIAVLPDYSFKASASSSEGYPFAEPLMAPLGTSISGIIGSLLTFSFTVLIGLLCYTLNAYSLRLKHKV